MLREILPDVWCIGVPLPGNPLKELNSYLFRGKERDLLIDTGFRMTECRDALLHALGSLRVDMHRTDILLTHLHSDHTGLAPEIASGETRVFLTEEDRRWLVRKEREEREARELASFRTAGMPESLLERAYSTHPGYRFAPDPDFDRYEPVADGDVLRAGRYRLQVVRVPGHTPGQICLWLGEQQVLFSADHMLFDITPNIGRWVGMENALGSYLDSLRKIRNYPARTVFPSHRKSGSLAARTDELLAHHAFRLNECLRVIREEPGLTAYDIAGRMTWRIRARSWDGFPAPQKWFAVGECLSHIDYLTAEGRIREWPDGPVLRYEAVTASR